MRTNLLIGATGFAALFSVVPAEAQYYPPPRQGGLGQAIVNQVLGYGQYPYGNYGYNQYGRERYAIDRCARSVEQRIGGYGSNYNWGYGGGYNVRRYGNGGRVLGITRVERRSSGGFKVWGVAGSGWGGYEGWNRPGYGNYGYSQGADLRWECKVTRSGRVSDIDIRRRSANWRGY